jgi:hypothetical protein
VGCGFDGVKHFQDQSDELQIPPLRYAPVGMTLFFATGRGWVRSKGNCRSLDFAPPDFLWNLVVLVHFMRLSLTGAHIALSSAAWQEIRVGMTLLLQREEIG